MQAGLQPSRVQLERALHTSARHEIVIIDFYFFDINFFFFIIIVGGLIMRLILIVVLFAVMSPNIVCSSIYNPLVTADGEYDSSFNTWVTWGDYNCVPHFNYENLNQRNVNGDSYSFLYESRPVINQNIDMYNIRLRSRSDLLPHYVDGVKHTWNFSNISDGLSLYSNGSMQSYSNISNVYGIENNYFASASGSGNFTFNLKTEYVYEEGRYYSHEGLHNVRIGDNAFRVLEDQERFINLIDADSGKMIVAPAMHAAKVVASSAALERMMNFDGEVILSSLSDKREATLAMLLERGFCSTTTAWAITSLIEAATPIFNTGSLLSTVADTLDETMRGKNTTAFIAGMGFNDKASEVYDDFINHRQTIDGYRKNGLAVPYEEIVAAYDSYLLFNKISKYAIGYYEASYPDSGFEPILNAFSAIYHSEIQPYEKYFFTPFLSSQQLFNPYSSYALVQLEGAINGFIDAKDLIYDSLTYSDYVEAVFNDAQSEAAKVNVQNYLNVDTAGFSAFLKLAYDKKFTNTLVQNKIEVILSNENTNIQGPGSGTIIEIDGKKYADLTCGSPVWMDINIDNITSDFILDFNYIFKTSTGELQVFVNDMLLAVIPSMESILFEELKKSFYVDYDFINGLDNPYIRFLWDGKTGSQISIYDIVINEYDYVAMEKFATPEPGSLALLLFGSLLIISLFRYRASKRI